MQLLIQNASAFYLISVFISKGFTFNNNIIAKRLKELGDI